MIKKADRQHVATEFVAAVSTFLTMSYILLLNPVLLSRTGIDLSAAFFATAASAAIATLVMGWFARLPFAVAPAPSITTFFVSYVCLTMGLSWQAALAAVIVSGVISLAMALLTVRQKLIEATSPALRIGILFAIGGFLIANGLSQVKIVGFTDGLLDLSKSDASWAGVVVVTVGLVTTLVFRLPIFRFPGAPLLGIIAAAATAFAFGFRSNNEAVLGPQMFDAVFKADFSGLLDPRIFVAIFVFFVIDFFGGVGKFVGLFAAMDGSYEPERDSKPLGRALLVDGFGNIVGGFLGAGSLAVFISSAVGVKAGGRTGLVAIFIAIFIAISIFAIPLVGSIPAEATSGILIYVGLILIPWSKIWSRELTFSRTAYLIFALAAVVGFVTFGIDKALLVVFAYFSWSRLAAGFRKEDAILHITTVLLAASVAVDLLT